MVDRGERPFVILVHSGYRPFREYLLKMVAGHARVWLFLDAEPTWEQPYIAGHTVVDLGDAGALEDAARALSQRHAVAGVLCWNELLVEQAARLQEDLGLPGAPLAAVSVCRDKHLTRRALDAAEVPQAVSASAASAREAEEAARSIGLPVIVKPRALGASVGVKKAASLREVAGAYAEASSAAVDGAPDFGASVLVEEFLQGEEVSIDAALHDGGVTPLFVARKVIGFEPYCEEIAHSVDARDPLLDDPHVLDVLRRAHRAVGYHTGITHTELMLTRSGPKVIEINARLGGDLIPLVASHASDVDPGQAVVAIACGQPPQVPGRRPLCAAIRFLYPEQDCVVAEVYVDEAALPPSAAGAGPLVEPGHKLRPPPAEHVTSRFAYVLVTGESADECWSEADKAAAAVHLRSA